MLTAAHCVEGEKAGDLQVAVGRTNLDDLSSGQTLRADRIVVHPTYAETGTFDAALVRVSRTDRVPPASRWCRCRRRLASSRTAPR